MLHQMLKMLRLNNKMTQKQVAEFLNIDRSTYSYYETGKTQPNVDTLVKLCCIFDVSMDVLTEVKRENCDTLNENAQGYLSDTENLQTFESLNRREQQILRLFRLCENKDEAIEKLKDLVVSMDNEEKNKSKTR